MESRTSNTISPSITVKDMQKSLDFYTNTLGFQTSDKLTRKDGRIAHATVGLGSPLLMLSSLENVRTPVTKDELSKNKPGIGVEFYIGLSGVKKIDAFYAEVKAKGVTVLNEPKTEFWGDRIFTVKDPDGYALTFSEHVNDVTPEARTVAFENANSKS